MTFPGKILPTVGVLLLSLAPLTPATAAGPGVWAGGHAFGHFGLGAAIAHSVFGLAALPLAIVGAAAAAAQSQDQGYGPSAGYYPPPNAYYAPTPAYYPPAPRYYAPYPPAPNYYYPPRVGYYAAPAGYYGARPGYHGRPGYQVSRRSGYYYPR
jgi:hypothetical protein